MRITYFYAENMAGIKEGPGLDKIEINFNQDPRNVFTLILGSNGAGKSVILSLIHPFRETYDGRQVVKDGEKAYKEIHIQDKDDEYIIKHTWKPNKSFIYKNGEDLNESGSIKEFMKVIKSELGIDDDYFKIARLGSNVTNFIELTSGMRKTYIGNYLPYIDDYLNGYEVAKKKYTLLNKELNNIGSQLDKFPELDTLREQSTELSSRIKGLEKSKEDKNKKVVRLDGKILQLKAVFEAKHNLVCDDKVIESNQDLLEETESRYKRLKRKYSALREEIISASGQNGEFLKSKKTFKILLGETEVIYETQKKELNEIDIKLQSLTQINNNLRKEIEVYQKRVSLDYEFEIDKIETIIEENDTLIEELQKQISKLEDKYGYLISDLDYDVDSLQEVQVRINKLQASILNIISLYNLESEINPNLVDEYDNIVNLIVKYEHEEQDLESKISYTNKNEKLISILNKRPEDCKDDNCGFIKNALDYKNNYYNHLSEFESRYEEVKANLEDLRDKLEIIKKTRKVLSSVNSFVSELKLIIAEYGIDFDITEFNKSITKTTMLKFMKRDVNYISKSLSIDEAVTSYIKPYYNLQDLIANSESHRIRLKELQIGYENDKNDRKHYKSKLVELDTNTEELNELSKTHTDLYNQVEETETLLSNLHEIIELLDDMKEAKNAMENTQSIIELYNEYLEDVKTNQEEIDEIEDELERIETELEKFKSDKEKVDKDLNYVEILLGNKEELDEKFKHTKLVRDALDPKKGIPLLFIDKFLDKIEIKTNELLELAYGSSFKIHFELTDKDFFIRVLKTFSMLDDIGNASQGETSLTTVSLSLAMVQYMVRKYNILYLDEIDGALSTHNRRIFLSMLEKQIDELGIEQIFIISHNNEFYSYPVNLILLNMDETDIDINDKGFISNKHIDFNLAEYKDN